jgi:hypothetical protein
VNEADPKELLPLRQLVYHEIRSRPVMLTDPGIADLAARIAVATAVWMGKVVGRTEDLAPGDPVPDPHRCAGCGEPYTETKHGRACLHLAACARLAGRTL